MTVEGMATVSEWYLKDTHHTLEWILQGIHIQQSTVHLNPAEMSNARCVLHRTLDKDSKSFTRIDHHCPVKYSAIITRGSQVNTQHP